MQRASQWSESGPLQVADLSVFRSPTSEPLTSENLLRRLRLRPRFNIFSAPRFGSSTTAAIFQTPLLSFGASKPWPPVTGVTSFVFGRIVERYQLFLPSPDFHNNLMIISASNATPISADTTEPIPTKDRTAVAWRAATRVSSNGAH